MMGMMTMLRVLPDAQYTEIQNLTRQRASPKVEDHHHGR